MPVLWSETLMLGPNGRDTGAHAFATEGPWIIWIGRSLAGAPRCDRRIRLRGRVVSPGFIDGHVHLTPTGLALAGLDLSGSRSAADVGRRLARHVEAERPRYVWGGGWDDASPGWRGRGPSGSDLDRVAGDRLVYLTRVDSHSAVISSKLFEAAGCSSLDGAERDDRSRPTGIVKRDAHHAARRYMLDHIPASRLADAQLAAARNAAAAGITTVHEMGGPHVTAGERDLDVLLSQRKSLPVDVVVYYATEDVEVPRSRDLRTIGGDLNVDGALGSRTAALRRPYTDARGHRGFLYRDAGDCAEFFTEATRAGLQGGVHCIGDAACEAAVKGLERAARRTSLGAVRRLRHRLEHFEMASRELIARAARLGAALSMQPAFDAAWGGPGGMYAARAGAARARRMNHVRAGVHAGCVVGFGSDSPVTAFDPLGAVRAASAPSVRSHAVGAEQAFRSATLGAAALAREETIKGRIAVGYRADFVVWEGRPPALSSEVVATVLRGRVVHGRLTS